MKLWATMGLGKLRNNGNSCSKYGQGSSPDLLPFLEISQTNLSPLTSSDAPMRLVLEAVFGNDTLGNANDWRKSLAFELT